MCSTFISHKVVKARKTHRCVACAIPIPPSFDYVITFEILDDGKGYTTKWHSECRSEFDRMLTEQHDDCGDPSWTWDGGLPPEIWQKYFYGPPDPTERQWGGYRVL